MTEINHPDYYNSGGIEVADFIDAHGLNFNLGNIVKYIARAGKKDGEDILTALMKAQWYLSREIIRAGREQVQAEDANQLEQLLIAARPAYHLPEDE